MLTRPQWRPDADVRVVAGEGVFVVSEQGTALLRGRLYEMVAPLLDGTRTVDEVAAVLGDEEPAATVFYAITRLQQKGYVVEQAEGLTRGEAALLAAQHGDPVAALRRLSMTSVAVRTVGGTPLVDPLPMLESVHLAVSNPGDVLLVGTDDLLHPALAAVNDDALRERRPWMLVRPVGLQLLIGPILKPGMTGCWECLASRLRVRTNVERFLEASTGEAAPTRGAHCTTPAIQHVAWSIAANRLAQWIASGGDATFEGVLSVDVRSWRTDTHTLVRRPQCPRCGARGSNPRAALEPVALVSRRKPASSEGGGRTEPASTTLRRLEHHVSPLTGAISSLQRLVTSDDDVWHVFIAGHNYALPRRSVTALRASLRNCSAGKGTTEIEARASGLCEGLERYSAVFEGTEYRVRGRFSRMGTSAIHPNSCMLFSPRQYLERDVWNASGSVYTRVPIPFDEDADLDWTPLWSLTHKTFRYLPTALCYFDVPPGEAARESSLVACSNGNAAGSTIEEAVLHGLFELIERDSVALWWYTRLRRPGVDLGSFSSPYLDRLAATLRHHHREIWALDLTADIGVPAFVALSRRTDGPREEIAFGFGAHLDARIALTRAVTEMNQILGWLVFDSEEARRQRQLDPLIQSWLNTATVSDQTHLLPDPAVPPRRLKDYHYEAREDVLDDIRECQRRLEARGLEVLILDQTRPDIGLPVAKIVVPGLRHFWARLAPGRLYDVPPALGWTSGPMPESDLNPIPLFL